MSSSDTAAALNKTFSQPEVDQGQLEDLRQKLGAYVERHNKGDEHSSARLQDELRTLYKSYVVTVSKLGSFMTVLRDLQPAIVAGTDILEWVDTAFSTFIEQTGLRKDSVKDAQDFVLGAMLYDEETSDARERGHTSSRLVRKLLESYIARTKVLAVDTEVLSIRSQTQAEQQLASVILSFGRRQPKQLFDAIDHFLLEPDTRYQILHLLSAWLQQQHAHLDLVVHTSLVEHLLKSLMNDRSTAVVSVALQCLVMLLPHIPATVSKSLPRLFLIYSRCLCWEKFSSQSSRAQKDHVTDDRVRRPSDSEDEELFSIDPTWKVLNSVPGSSDTTAPELLTYFTYLYGLYPLNFMSYIRKPRKYLKSIDFPGTDSFDLDQAVIRSRTEQYQRAHLLHPSFFNITAEEELEDNRWLKAEPSEVVAECLGLYSGGQIIPTSPGPPPTTRLPALPPLTPVDALSPGSQIRSGAASPAISLASAPSAPPSLWQNITSPRADVGSPIVNPMDKIASESTRIGGSIAGDTLVHIEPSRPGTAASTDAPAASLSDGIYLQRELLLLRNELTFERYLKQQHVLAIGQLKRDRIKAVTMEAETATLINANRALQKKLSDAAKFNEKMQKETQSRKTHTKQSEDLLTAKLRSLRSGLEDQEALQTNLKKAISDSDKLRQLLVESEAREMRTNQENEINEDKILEMEAMQNENADLKSQLRTAEDREMQVSNTEAEQTMLRHDLEAMRVMVANRDQERDRSKKAFQAKIADLEARLATSGSNGTSSATVSPDIADLQARLADAQSKQLSMKRAYTKVLQELTELKVNYEDLTNTSSIAVDGPAIAPGRQPPQPHVYSSSNLSMAAYPQELWQGPPVGQTYRQPDYVYSQSYDNGSGISIGSNAGQSFPPNRPVRPEVYDQQMRYMDNSPLSRSEGAAGHQEMPFRHASFDKTRPRNGSSNMSTGNGSHAGSFSRQSILPGSPSNEMLLHSNQSAFSLNSDDQGSEVEGDAKSGKGIFGRGKSSGSVSRKEKKEKPPPKTGGFRGLKGLM